MRHWIPIALIKTIALSTLLTGCTVAVEPPQAPLSGHAVRPVAAEVLTVVDGQTIYVPAYTGIFFAGTQKTWDLAVTLAIRNTDTDSAVIVKSARLYDVDGNVDADYVTEPLELAPLGTTTIVLARDDNRGGVGAKFIVEWAAEHEVHEPVVETVMVSTAGSQALAFSSRGQVIAGESLELSRNQSVYVPAYSDIFFDDSRRTLDLAITLAIHNTDAIHPITIKSIRYYDTGGTLVAENLDAPLSLAPWATTNVVIERDDTSGGIGANFIVDWEADAAVSTPRIESIIVSTAGSHGVAFTGSGQGISQEE